MYKKIAQLWVLFTIFCGYSATSQTVRLIRTDVDSTRESFVTATYMFAFDIAIDNLENCNNATFRLKFDNARYVKFSGSSIVDFGEEGTLFINQNTISGGDEVILDIGIFSGQALQENEFDSPILINLEFVVLPIAPDEEIVTFTFENAFGGTFQDGVGQSIPLATIPVNYDIHGFVEVWPGDTDRDGDVDNLDWQLYTNLFYSERFPGFRSFKRKNPSTLWKPQRALVWDQEDATYGDCDGDGEISVTDGAVVLLNIEEDNGEAPGPVINDGTTSFENQHEEAKDKTSENLTFQESEIIIPIYANNINYYGVIGSIEIEDNFKNSFLEIQRGELFENSSNIVYELKDNTLEFVLGDFDKDFLIENKGIIAFLKFKSESNITNADIEINNLKGITRSKKLIDLNLISNLEERNSNDIKIVDAGTHFEIRGNEVTNSSAKIFDINGKLISNINLKSTKIIQKSSLPKGFLIISIDGLGYPIINK